MNIKNKGSKTISIAPRSKKFEKPSKRDYMDQERLEWYIYNDLDSTPYYDELDEKESNLKWNLRKKEKEQNVDKPKKKKK